MFSILKPKQPYEQEAKAIYAQCLNATRNPAFYTHHMLPDTMEARFDLLLVHIYLIIERNLNDASLDGESFNQVLFDTLFKDMDQTLREMGIGDTGVSKRIKKMMLGFNGRMHTYQSAFEQVDSSNNTEDLEHAIARNVYGANPPTPESEILASYIIHQRSYIASLSFAQLTSKNPLYIIE